MIIEALELSPPKSPSDVEGLDHALSVSALGRCVLWGKFKGRRGRGERCLPAVCCPCTHIDCNLVADGHK